MNGTLAGTILLKEFGFIVDLGKYFIVLVGRIYFVANGGSSGSELWAKEGTREGTTMVANIILAAAVHVRNTSQSWTTQNPLF
jgi:ELWxxDGT repeat protein